MQSIAKRCLGQDGGGATAKQIAGRETFRKNAGRGGIVVEQMVNKLTLCAVLV